MFVLKSVIRTCPLHGMMQSTRQCSSTIFALSSSIRDRGSAIAVIRISGKNSLRVLQCITSVSKAEKCFKKPRSAILAKLYHPQSRELLDEGIVIWYGKPHSYTGEDVCELHVHGSNAGTSAILKAIGLIEGCRHAEPGEFTKRAFLNAKMDLIRAEGIADLIAAQTESQRRRAVSGASGKVTRVLDGWRSQIIQYIAHLEANIDFGEDELIDEQVLSNVKRDLTILVNDIRQYLSETARKSDLIKGGLQVSIIGEPNVGKSTLINLLSERDLSIVSPISGTTRDVVETWLNINGYAIRVGDTAGIKDLQSNLNDLIEIEGIKRAIKRAQDSDLVILVIDANSLFNSNTTQISLQSMLPSYLNTIVSDCSQCLYIINKIDLLKDDQLEKLENFLTGTSLNVCYLSCTTKQGFEECLSRLTQMVERMCGNPLDESLFTSERQESHLIKVCEHLEYALESIASDMAISAYHLRQTANHISHITGKITNEHILDVIFRDFCIGK